MARQRVSIWVRPGINFEKVNPRQQYPLNTTFFLRYTDSQGKRVWERIHPDRRKTDRQRQDGSGSRSCDFRSAYQEVFIGQLLYRDQ